MSRNKQQLINYHTGSKTNMPLSGDVQFGEIVVRHNNEKPELLIKVSSGTSNTESYGEYFENFMSAKDVKSEVQASIAESDGRLQSEISNLGDKIEAVSATVKETYWTSAETQAQIAAASGYSLDQAKAYADTQDDALSGRIITHVQTAITNAITGDVQTLQNKVSALEAFSGVVESTYATKEFVGSASGYALTKAKEDLIGESTDEKTADTIWGAKNYADDAVKTLSGDVVSYVDNQITTINNDNTTLSEKIDSLSGTVSAMSGELKTYIDNELSTVYTYKGSVATFEELPANAEVGDVYNVIAQVGEPGDANYTPAGTNYAWVAANQEMGEEFGRWDALGGTVDLTAYQSVSGFNAYTASTEQTLTDHGQRISTNETNIETVSGNLVTLSGSVVEDYATSADTVAAIAAAKNEAVTSAYTASSVYTDQQINVLSGITSAYVANQVTTINNSIDTILDSYALSAVTHDEIEAAKTAVIGTDENTSAQTTTLEGLKKYSDEKDRLLREDLNDTINSLSGLVVGDFSGIESAITNIQSTVGQHDTKITNIINSAATWNTATHGAEFGTVATTDTNFYGGSGSGATVDSNAKLKYADGGKITLDLSELIIDCGDFQ